MIYNLIYYIYGHSFYIDKNNPENDSLRVQIEPSGTIVTIPDLTDNITSLKIRIKYLFCFLYNAIIIIFIGWSNIYTIIDAIQTNNINLIFNEIFQFAFLIQYMIGLWYFNTSEYPNIISKSNEISKTFEIVSVIFLILSISITALTIGLILSNNGIVVDSLFFNVYSSSPEMIVLLCLNRFYSYASFFANMTIFFLQMYYSKKSLDTYTSQTTIYISSSFSLLDKIINITNGFQQLKNNYDTMINNLNLFFSSLTIIGTFGLYFTIINIFLNNINSIEIINSILFLITEIMYINTAQSSRSSIDLIKMAIKDPILYQEFNKKKKQTDMGINNDPDERELTDNIKSVKEICTVTYMCCKELEENLLWKKLDTIINSEWETFRFFGIKIQDTDLLQKVFGLIIGFVFTANFINVINFAIL